MNRAIVTSFDANYFEYSAVALKSFADNYNGSKVLEVICLVPVDLINREAEYVKLLNVSDKLRIRFRSSNKYEDLVSTGAYTFKELKYISQNAMQRVFLGSTLQDFDEAIYIDPDTLILRDVQPLLEYPLHNKLMACQEPDIMNVRTFNDPDRPYFNNGVFIADLRWWRASGVEGQMVRWLKEHGPTQCIEQDLMNRFMINVWSPLPTSFNYRMAYAGVPLYKDCTPLLLHFVGDVKPWSIPIEIEPLEYEQMWIRAHRKYKNGVRKVATGDPELLTNKEKS